MKEVISCNQILRDTLCAIPLRAKATFTNREYWGVVSSKWPPFWSRISTKTFWIKKPVFKNHKQIFQIKKKQKLFLKTDILSGFNYSCIDFQCYIFNSLLYLLLHCVHIVTKLLNCSYTFVKQRTQCLPVDTEGKSILSET